MSANSGDPAPVAGERGSRGHIRGSAPVGAVLAAFSLLAMGGAACSSLTQGTAPVPSTGAYVALGDSYTSGPFIPRTRSGLPRCACDPTTATPTWSLRQSTPPPSWT